jgi:hypothetical protein
MIDILIKNFVYDLCLNILFENIYKSMKTQKKSLVAGTTFSDMEYYEFDWSVDESYSTYEKKYARNVYLIEEIEDFVYLFKINGEYITLDLTDIIAIEGSILTISGYITYV